MSEQRTNNTRTWLLLLAGLVIVTLIIGGSGSGGNPYSPRSVDPDGARGIVEVLESLGAEVTLENAVPASTSTSALILEDRLIEDDRFAITQWVRNGGVLVVADKGSSFIEPVGLPMFGSTIAATECSIAALAQVGDLEAPNASEIDINGLPSCHLILDGALVVARPEGEGTIVSVGSRDLFSNEFLDEADNAALAVSLLAPDPGEAAVTFVGTSVLPTGDVSDGELLGRRVFLALLQFLAAFLLYALHRMRRLGKVVAEPLPVVIEGSELVLQAGVLSERANDPLSAAQVLREDFLDRAHQVFGIGASVDGSHEARTDDPVVAIIAERSGTSPESVVDALMRHVATDDDLVAVGRELTNLEIGFGGRTAAALL